MQKSWLSWLKREAYEGEERRAGGRAVLEPVSDTDTDPLTGALSWHRFMAVLDQERQLQAGCLLLVDLNAQSRMLTDATPGAEGDVLPLLAKALRQAIREDDLVAHSDGYRFAVLLRGASQDIGRRVSERILDSVENTIFITSGGIAPLDVAVGGSILDGEAIIALNDARNRLEIAVQSGEALRF